MTLRSVGGRSRTRTSMNALEGYYFAGPPLK